MFKEIYYITEVRLPTEKAHGYQVMKMCEVFSEQGCKVSLVVPKLHNTLLEDPFIFYNLKIKGYADIV